MSKVIDFVKAKRKILIERGIKDKKVIRFPKKIVTKPTKK